MSDRVDARAKARGETVYAGDIELPGMVHAALVRSDIPHGVIRSIDVERASSMPGVIGVYTADHVSEGTYGRRVRDLPILARGKVRHIGERVAAVVARTRREAELAAMQVRIEYDGLPPVLDPAAAISGGAPLIHEAAWSYRGAVVTADDPPNTQSVVREGASGEALEALGRSRFSIDRTYATPAGHAGYIEPQVCVATVDPSGDTHVWSTNKAPYRLRDELADCLGIESDRVVVHPVAIGGDFGGKGSYGEVPLCVELARITGRPVSLALRQWEDLVSTHPRHSASIRVRIGCAADGRFTALHLTGLIDGGAYADGKARRPVDIHGIVMAGSPYSFPAFSAESIIAYTNSVPRGHVRAPGGPQAVFAVESAVDELACEAGIDPVEIRRVNLLRPGQASPQGTVWEEVRGHRTLEAALGSPSTASAPPGWLRGTGLAVYDRGTPRLVATSMRLSGTADGGLTVEIPQPETGTGSHTVVRDALAIELGVPPETIETVHVPTSALPYDRGVGASRVTLTMALAATELALRWKERGASDSVEISIAPDDLPHVTSYCVQVADVAVDPRTGQVEVLDLLTAVDVADVLHPAAHRMQIDGGAVMGYGFARFEDLRIEQGQVFASTLGEFRIPTSRDVPPLRTVLVSGGRGVGHLNVKAIGEVSNVPTAAAIANAIADATGVRIRRLPILSEDVWAGLMARGGSESSPEEA